MATAAASSSPAETIDPKPDRSETLEPTKPASNTNPDPSPLPTQETPNPNPNPSPNPTVLAPPSAPSFTPSFRPAPPQAPQFSPLVNPSPAQNPSFQAAPAAQSPNLQPPGVAPSSLPPAPGAFAGPASGAAAVSVPPPPVYYSVPVQTPGVAPRPYWQQPPPNGYTGVSAPLAQGLIAPPGVPRYPGPYPAVVRPGFPPRPPVPISVVPPVSRPLIPGTGGTPVPPVVRPVVPFVAPTEKPQTTVYVGKIASTVENDFLLSLLNLCGPVKSWKRAQDPSDGTPRGFGFCEFESAEGVLRALRLLTKLNIDGQELVLNIKQATREYLERYVAKKTEREKHKETEGDVVNEENSAPAVEKQGSPKPDGVSKTEVDGSEKEKQDDPQNFGIVTDEDRDADKDALEKIKNMIEERLKKKPLPPPPPVPSHTDGAAKSNSELPSKSKEGESELDVVRSAEDKNEEITSDNKHIERDKSEASSERSRRHDRSRERERERDMKRDKERELERYERERERERVRRERERELKIREAERYYKDRLKDWEGREREKEYRRQYEREKEKEREIKRRRDIMDQEDESDEDDDDTRKRRHRSSTFEEKRRKVLREKEDDIADRLKEEEEEVAEAKRRAIEEKKEEFKPLTPVVSNVSGGSHKESMNIDGPEISSNQSKEGGPIAGDAIPRNGIGDESNMGLASVSDAKQSNSIASRKLGFGLMTAGKRTSVPSVFHEEDEDVDKDKKMRPLVPIDYSKEELQAIQETPTPPHLAAAAEFAKRISAANNKEEKCEPERERSRRNNERHRDRDRNDDSKHSRYEHREKMHDKSVDRDRERDGKPKTMETKKLLDAKQLIDMIPKTKEELFSYQINWTVYEKQELHERMKPWISKKITEFLGEEEPTLVDYIVSSTKDHVQASEMLQLLQPILDEEAEMFVLKMWRMLIFEIKKVETGLSTKTRT